MTITLDLAPELQAELARQAEAQGVGIDAYAVSLIETAARNSKLEAALQPPDVAEAIETLRNFGKAHHLSLGDMTIRQLRHEARP